MWYFGDLDVRLELAPPALGQHTIKALTSVGVDIEELGLLIAHRAARQGIDTTVFGSDGVAG